MGKMLAGGVALAGFCAVFVLFMVRRTLARRQEVSAPMLGTLLEQVHDAVIAWTLDGQVVYWNHGAESLYGWSKGETIGRNVDKVLGTEVSGHRDPKALLRPCPARVAGPGARSSRPRGIVAMRLSKISRRRSRAGLDDAHGVSITLERVLDDTADMICEQHFMSKAENVARKSCLAVSSQGARSRVIDISREIVQTTRDRRRLILESRMATVRCGRGSTVVVQANHDVTESRRAEQARIEGESRYRAVVETAVDGIITIDAKGIVRSFNKAAERMFEYRAGEVIGNNVNMLMPEPYRGEHDGYLARFYRTGEKRIIGIGREVSGRRKSGRVFPVTLLWARRAWGAPPVHGDCT